MSKLGFAGAVVAIVAVATWTYNINYQTKTTLGRINDTRAEISAERERIQVLRVEWAWLNNPERLERLTERYAERLALQPLNPSVFGKAGALPLPPEDETGPNVDPVLLATLADAHAAGLASAPMGPVMPIPRPISHVAE